MSEYMCDVASLQQHVSLACFHGRSGVALVIVIAIVVGCRCGTGGSSGSGRGWWWKEEGGQSQ